MAPGPRLRIADGTATAGLGDIADADVTISQSYETITRFVKAVTGGACIQPRNANDLTVDSS
jgi:hypothetical protein